MIDKRKLPVGIQSFEDLRNNDYLYVDKTKSIWKLVQSGKSYFLSRPRRFGKSLLVSTMEAYFQGKKNLFHGLAIEKLEKSRKEKAWQEYPVILFSLSSGDYQAPDGLAQRLNDTLSYYEKDYEINSSGIDLPNRFFRLIRSMYAKSGRQVVVLVDEYDKPLLETMIINEKQSARNRRLYKGFFSVLKDADRYLKFVFFTGVTKFSKVSIFSDLNQLRDISLSVDYADICGITEKEMIDNFKTEILATANKQKISTQECIRQLAQMYDGYHFSAEGVGVYNPYSLLNAFADGELSTYWFDTGTPSSLVRMLKKSSFTVEMLADGVEASELSLKNYRPEDEDPIPLFYQTGYLTICGFDREFRIYSLKFPNNEVKYSFLNYLMKDTLGTNDASRPAPLRKMILALRQGNIDNFMEELKSLFAGIPYPMGTAPQYEHEWQGQIYLVLALLGQYVQCEVHSSYGRADCVVKTRKFIYIFEFKLDQAVDRALTQIKEKGYAQMFQTDPRQVLLVGVSFSSQKRNVEAWQTAAL